MRHARYRIEPSRALGLLTQAPVVQLSTTDPEGRPVLRALNFVIAEGYAAFHGAPVGEKTLAAGRMAVLGIERTVASIPSYFIDPERACPATTFYESVQVSGVLEVLDDAERKASVLSTLMKKYQPEGGYREIQVEDAYYRRALASVCVMGIRLANVSGKAKLGQNRSPAEITRIAEALWRRGAPGDAAAIRCILEANPEAPRPALFRALEGVSLEPALDERDAHSALSLLAGTYWTRGFPVERLARAHLGSQAWIGARAADGSLIATARAMTDGARFAHVADVAIREDFRGRGLGTHVMRLLLDHPALRGAQLVRLGTADAQGFYARFGFVPQENVDFGFPVSTLLLRRA